MRIIDEPVNGLKLIEPDLFKDERGFFLETYQRNKFQEIGIQVDFVQDNHSRSKKNILRGLHFQKTKPQGKLVRVSRGKIFDVALDIRKESDHYGEWYGVELTDENQFQLYIPPGFAHGFCVLSEVADFEYKCTDFYNPNDEGGIIWNDPVLKIDWPISDPILSKKDKSLPPFESL